MGRGGFLPRERENWSTQVVFGDNRCGPGEAWCRPHDLDNIYVTVGSFFVSSPEIDHYKSFKTRVGRFLILGLEILVAAEIIKTAALTPTFTSVGVLALLVLVRTFLSWTLVLEIEGHWPWQPEIEGTVIGKMMISASTTGQLPAPFYPRLLMRVTSNVVDR